MTHLVAVMLLALTALAVGVTLALVVSVVDDGVRVARRSHQRRKTARLRASLPPLPSPTQET